MKVATFEQFANKTSGEQFVRTRLPEGWLVGKLLADGDIVNLTFVPDANHAWELETVETNTVPQPNEDTIEEVFEEDTLEDIVIPVEEEEDVLEEIVVAPTPTPVPVTPPPVVIVPADTIARPTYARGNGFFVHDGKLFDPTGHEFIMHGMNHTLWWGWKEHNTDAIPEIAKTGANTIRLVFGSNNGHTTVAEKDAAFASAIKSGMVPVPGLWWSPLGEVTGSTDPTRLRAAFDYWLQPEHVALLKKYERDIILNPANEWGPFNDGVFFAEYVNGIAKLRSAGINCTIMIDASGAYGQNPRSILNVGADILNADPCKNVIFGLHLYAYHRSPDKLTGVGSWNDSGTQSPWDTIAEVKKIQAKKIPLVIGEIGAGGPQVPYNPKEMMKALKSLGIGWLAWSWNQNSDSNLDMFKVNSEWRYLSDDSLSTGGLLFIKDPDVGFKSIAKKAFSLLN